MLVVVQVASTTDELLAVEIDCPRTTLAAAPEHPGAPARTHGRSFFEHQAGTVQEGPDRADRHRDPGLVPQPLLHLSYRDVGLTIFASAASRQRIRIPQPNRESRA